MGTLALRGEGSLTLRFLSQLSCAAAAVLVLGCSKAEPAVGCPRPPPPFRLQLTAEQGALPYDTHLVVQYQGMLGYEEGYDILHPPSSNYDVCCRLGDPVVGKLPSVPCKRAAPSHTPQVEGGRVEAGLSLDGASDTGPSASHDASVSQEGGSPLDVASGGDGGGSDSGGGLEAAPSPTALLCELWTGGPAHVAVVGTGYPSIDRELSVEFDDCGPVTRDVRIVWSRRDGGQ